MAVRADYAELGEVMFEAVRQGCPTYTPEQLQAWVPVPPAGAVWNERLAAQSVFVAVAGAQILGFLSLADGGTIDLAFIRPAAQGTGLFRRLYQALEHHALAAQTTRLTVYASLMAEPAFSAVGFKIVQQETVHLRSQALVRYEMNKVLTEDSGTDLLIK